MARSGELTRVVALRTLSEMVEASTGERLNDLPARDFLAGLGVRADKSLRGVTGADLERFRTESTAAGKSNGSANMDLRIIRITLDAAKRQGIITHNPAEAVESLPDDERERAPFTDEQVRLLLKEADTLSFHSCRHTFVAALTNADVNSDIRKAIAGHACDRAHERYTHLAIETPRRALSRLHAF